MFLQNFRVCIYFIDVRVNRFNNLEIRIQHKLFLQTTNHFAGNSFVVLLLKNHEYK